MLEDEELLELDEEEEPLLEELLLDELLLEELLEDELLAASEQGPSMSAP